MDWISDPEASRLAKEEAMAKKASGKGEVNCLNELTM